VHICLNLFTYLFVLNIPCENASSKKLLYSNLESSTHITRVTRHSPAILATFLTQVMTEIKFATSTHHRVNRNDVLQCVHPVNERPTTVIRSIALLISPWLITSNNCWASYHMVIILYLLTIYQLLIAQEHPKLNNSQDSDLGGQSDDW